MKNVLEWTISPVQCGICNINRIIESRPVNYWKWMLSLGVVATLPPLGVSLFLSHVVCPLVSAMWSHETPVCYLYLMTSYCTFIMHWPHTDWQGVWKWHSYLYAEVSVCVGNSSDNHRDECVSFHSLDPFQALIHLILEYGIIICKVFINDIVV